MNATTVVARALALSALAACTIPAAASAAVAGDPDPTFGTAGRRLLPGAAAPVDVLVQPDGKTVLVSDSGGFVVTRLNVDGTLDRSFGGDGTAVADFGADDIPTAGAVQPDGKVVVTGSAKDKLAIARFDADGQLDATFDADGQEGDGRNVIATETGPADVVVQDGLISLATTRGTDIGVVRMTETGALEPTVFQPVDFGGDETAAAAAAGPGATLVVAGRAAAPGGAPATAIARYTLDGKLDPTLAGTGKTLIPAIGEPKSVLVADDGTITVTGTSGDVEPHTVVARLETGGAPDESFATKGVADVDFEGFDTAAGAALTPDGKVLVAASGRIDSVFSAARLTAAGTPDSSFGQNGFTQMPVADVFAVSTAAAATADGRLVIAGVAVQTGPVPRPVVTRMLAAAPPAPVPDPEPAAPTPTPSAIPTLDAPQPVADTQAPELGALTLAPPFVRFTLSEPARVRFALKRRKSPAQAFSANAGAGANQIRIGRRVKAGRYRLTAIATDAAGNARRVSITVKKGRS